MKGDIFTSQMDGDAEQQDHGCGIACVMMLIKAHCSPRLVPTMHELSLALRANLDPRLKGYPKAWGQGVYPEDIRWFFEQLGVPLVETKSKPKDPARTFARRLEDGPIAVAMHKARDKRWTSAGHWIVLHDVVDGDLLYFDPAHTASDDLRNGRIGAADFNDCFDAAAFQLTPGLPPGKRLTKWPSLES